MAKSEPSAVDSCSVDSFKGTIAAFAESELASVAKGGIQFAGREGKFGLGSANVTFIY